MSVNWSEIDAWVDRARLLVDTPGMQIAVTDRNGLLHEAAFGFADIASQTPLTTDHLLETGSIGKSFTALALLQLVEEGKLNLHSPVTEYLPWFAVQSDFEPITLHHLLCHGAAISAGVDFAPTSKIQVWDLRNQRTSAPPGSMFHYSNLGYKVLGEILTAITGQSYGEDIRQRILEPLELELSIAEITSAERHRLANGYGPTFDDRPWWPGQPLSVATWLETDTADGCLAQPARELAGYLRMLMNRGVGPRGPLLTEESFALFYGRHNQVGDEEEDAWYGYGLFNLNEDGHQLLGHGGGMVGYSSGMLADLDTGYGVTAIVNGPGFPYWTAQSVLNHLGAVSQGLPSELPALGKPRDSTRFKGQFRPVEGTVLPLEFKGDPGTHQVTIGNDSFDLHPIEDHVFAVVDGDLGRYPFVVSESAEGAATVVSGPQRWVSLASPEIDIPSVQSEWSTYVGNYRSHNPWLTGFRVYVREGQLRLCVPSEPDGLEFDQQLVPIGDATFRAGEDPLGPETFRFDTVVDGKTLRAILVTSEFYRVQAP